MKPSDALAVHRAALWQLLKRYGFRHPRVFGSVLTLSDTEESDLDMLLEPLRGTTLFTLAGFEDEARNLTIPVARVSRQGVATGARVA